MRFSIIQPILTTAAVVCSLSAVIQPVSVSAEDSGLLLSECYVYDEAGVLTSEESVKLDELVYETAVDLQMNICVRLGANKLSSESDAREYAVADYLDRFGDDRNTDGIALYLDLYGSYIDDTNYAPHDFIATHGIAQLYFTNGGDDRVSEIFSEMNPHMKRGEEDPYTAVQIFCQELKSYYEKGIPKHYYVYDNEYDQYLYLDDATNQVVWSDSKPAYAARKQTLIAFGISFLVGLVVALVAMGIIHSHYRFKSKPSARIYIPSGKVQYGARQDQFLTRHVSRVKAESEHSSSGGHSSSGSSSGGFGGGGNSR